MQAALYEFFCAAFSAPQFRRWVRRLPDGRALAQALPEGHVDAKTLFDDSVDLFIRQKYIDAAFFTALAREFPRRHTELAELARTCGVHWAPPAMQAQTGPGNRHRWIGLAVALGLVGVLALQFGLGSTDELPVAQGRIDPDLDPAPTPAFIRSIHIPDARRRPKRPPPISTTIPTPTPPPGPVVIDVPKSPPMDPVCAMPGALRAELQALAQRTRLAPGVSKAFTVTLPSGADRPRVSPAPKPGETAIKQLYTHLTGLGPADLGHCRDRSIDVYFSADRTTVEFHE